MAKKFTVLDEASDLTPEKFDKMRQMMTGNGATTLTPENSEAPRESRGGELGERFDGLRKLQDERAVKVAEYLGQTPGKVSSPELASLAAKYVNMSDNQMRNVMGGLEPDGRPADTSGLHKAFCEDIRSLAASVLAQAEGTPRK
jgi:hypothetical protein